MIEVPDRILRDLKHMAIENDMSLKAYIEYIIYAHVEDNKPNKRKI